MCHAVLFAPRNHRRDAPEDEETFKTREDQFAQQDEYEYVYTFARRDQESLWIFHIIAKSPEDNRFAFSYDNLGVEAWEGSGKMEEANKRFVISGLRSRNSAREGARHAERFDTRLCSGPSTMCSPAVFPGGCSNSTRRTRTNWGTRGEASPIWPNPSKMLHTGSPLSIPMATYALSHMSRLRGDPFT